MQSGAVEHICGSASNIKGRKPLPTHPDPYLPYNPPTPIHPLNTKVECIDTHWRSYMSSLAMLRRICDDVKYRR